MSSKFISQLNYMSCMKESVRKYSTLLLVRLAMQDVSFTTADGQEFLLPQGTPPPYTSDQHSRPECMTE